MGALNYLVFFLAGMATLVVAVPQFASDNKLDPNKAPGFVYGVSRPVLMLLNVVALLPAIVVIAVHGILSLPTLLVLGGMIFGAVPVLAYLMPSAPSA